MFRRLRTRTTAFDRLIGALMCAGAIAYGYACFYGGGELAHTAAVEDALAVEADPLAPAAARPAEVDTATDFGTITHEFISIDVDLGALGGSILNAPVFRL